MHKVVIWMFIPIFFALSLSLCQANWVQDGGSANFTVDQDAGISSIAGYNSTPYIAWDEKNSNYGGKWHIYVKFYNGTDWEGLALGALGEGLNDDVDQNARAPVIVLAGATPYVTWYETSGGTEFVKVKFYNGTSWQESGAGGSLNFNLARDATDPCIAKNDSDQLYVTWDEKNDDYGDKRHIMVKYFNGSAWSFVGMGALGEGLNADLDEHADDPFIAVDGSTPYVTWYERDSGSGKDHIKVKKYNGVAWVALGGGGSLNYATNKNAHNPSVAVLGNAPYVAWQEENENYSNKRHIYVKYFNGSAWESSGLGALNAGLNSDPNEHADVPIITNVSGRPYVVWGEKDTSTAKTHIKVKHYEFPTLTVTPTESHTPSPTVSETPSPTVSETPSPTVSETPSPTVSETPSPTVSETPSPTMSETPSPTMSDTPSPTVSETPSPTVSETPSPTMSDTPSPTMSETPSPTVSDTPSPTVSDTPSPTVSDTPSPTMSETPSPIVTSTLSPTPSSTQTFTPEITSIPSSTVTFTPTFVLRASITLTLTLESNQPEGTGFAYPNPFFPDQGQKTTFYLENEELNDYSIRIFNLRGKQVRSLNNENQWDGQRTDGQTCESGLYILQWEKNGKHRNSTVVLLKE